ncbi:MAG TPA: hypothetical protein VF180_13360 [Acidimicrobiia bacterium]
MIRHGACGMSWTGAGTSHCSGCHETFTSLAAFDRHRRNFRCIPPAALRMVPHQRAWGIVWSLPVRPENKARLDALRAARGARKAGG